MPFTDPASGRQYEVDPTTGQSRWLPAPPMGVQPPMGMQPPKKKRRWPVWVFGGFGVLLLLGMCSAILHPAKDSVTPTAATSAATSKAAAPANKPPASSAAAAKASAPAAPKGGGQTLAQSNALRSAHSYLDMKGFSRLGLIQQLASEYGEGFSKADATWAVDHLDANWNEQAVRVAQSYLEMKGFSRIGLIEQLSSAYGEQFTKAEATYAADKVGLK